MSTPETDTPTDHDAPRDTLSDTPLDAAQRLGLARFRLGPDAPAWLLETLAFARDEANRMTRELADARAIIDGRTVPPTVAQVMALAADGGCVVLATGADVLSFNLRNARDLRSVLVCAMHPETDMWHATDGRGRPRAWPEVSK